MPGRTVPLVNGGFYHLYNRGTEKRDVFLQPRDYKRFRQTLYYYQFQGPKPKFSNFAKSNLTSFKPDPDKKLVDIICYTLMPNHFHFLVKQLQDNGISIFMSQLLNSYTKYFNTKYIRVGPLCQGAYKAVLVETDEQLLHLSRYIHLNPVVSKITNDLDDYYWSSYSEYINGQGNICAVDEILNFFPSNQKYQEFINDQINYSTSLEILKHKTIDINE